MKKLPYLLILIVAFAFVQSCKLDPDDAKDRWEYYKEWREANELWLQEQINKKVDGVQYYRKVVPQYDANAYVLIHYFNDRSQTLGNLSPIFTSTCDIKYYGRTYDNEQFDSSYLLTQNGDSIFRCTGASVIPGMAIALNDMRVGDSCEVIIPYQQAYGSTGNGSIKPYSNLIFSMKLVDIPAYEKKP